MVDVPALALELSERIHGTAVTSLSMPEVWERGGKRHAAASVHVALRDETGVDCSKEICEAPLKFAQLGSV